MWIFAKKTTFPRLPCFAGNEITTRNLRLPSLFSPLHKKREAFLQKLFSLEVQADDLEYTMEQRLEMRRTKSKAVLDAFYNWLTEVSLKTLPQSLLGKAVTYAHKQKEYIGRFLEDARIQLTNNLTEQPIKMFVIGRKNFLFSNTPNGVGASARLYGIIQTAIANDLRTLYYLEHVFEQLQKEPDIPVEKLLPWADEIPERCKNKKAPQTS